MSQRGAASTVSQFSQSRHLLLAMLAVVALAIVVRLPGIDRPLVGPFATKNAVYAMIARNWAEGRASLWYPTLDCLVGGQRALHMLEWPASAYLSGALWRGFGGSLDVWGRLTAVGFSAASVGILLLLVHRWHGRWAAVAAALLLALSPVSILYGRAFMLEASLVFFTLATFDALDRWLGGGRAAWLVCAAMALSLLLLTKVYMLAVLLPLGVMVVWPRGGKVAAGEGRDEGRERKSPDAALTAGPIPAGGRGKKWAGLLALAVAVLPAGFWYWHAAQTAATDGSLAAHVFYSVRDSAAVHRPPHPLLSQPDFYRQVLDDLAGVVLTPVGLVLLVAGFFDRAWRRQAAWLVSAAAVVVLLPLKFYEMNYYWLAVLPPLAVMGGLGWQNVSRGLQPARRAAAGFLIVGLLFSLRYTIGPTLITPEEDRAVVAAAAAVRGLAESGEPVVTMHGSTLDLLYYCDRPGWALASQTPDLEAALKNCQHQGARYIVAAGRCEGPDGFVPPAALSRYEEVARGEGFAVFDLTRAASP